MDSSQTKVNEAAFIGGITKQSVVASKPKKTAKSNAIQRMKKKRQETMSLLASSADRFELILKDEIEKEDSIVHLRSRLGDSPTDSAVATELRASEIYVNKLNQLLLLIRKAREDSVGGDDE